MGQLDGIISLQVKGTLQLADASITTCAHADEAFAICLMLADANCGSDEVRSRKGLHNGRWLLRAWRESQSQVAGGWALRTHHGWGMHAGLQACAFQLRVEVAHAWCACALHAALE